MAYIELKNGRVRALNKATSQLNLNRCRALRPQNGPTCPTKSAFVDLKSGRVLRPWYKSTMAPDEYRFLQTGGLGNKVERCRLTLGKPSVLSALEAKT
jgi:hypothetical protein